METDTFELRTGSREAVADITGQCAAFAARHGGDGLLHVFVPHATAGIAIIETGRLTFDEFNERVDEAYAARTDVDLNAALRELPRQPSHVQPQHRPHPPHRRRRRRAPWKRWAASSFTFVNGICIAVWAASGGGYFWPIWVLIPTGAICLRRMAITATRTKKHAAISMLSGRQR